MFGLKKSGWPAYPVLPGCTLVYRGKGLKLRYLKMVKSCQKMDNMVKKWSIVVKKMVKMVKQ